MTSFKESEPSTSSVFLPIIDERRPWIKKHILSPNGGGIRGFSQVMMLKALMVEVGKLKWEVEPEAKSSTFCPMLDKESIRLFRSSPEDADKNVASDPAIILFT